jgi:hypothetical protein
MKKLRALWPLLLLTCPVAWGDFSQSGATLHPRFPGAGPFIIEISGTWPTDCHPGEQRPVVQYYDGETVEIGFEIIVVHVTCNTVDTEYRVLVDMSGPIREYGPAGAVLAVRAEFQGTVLQQSLPLNCTDGLDCTGSDADRHPPEPGLYFSPGLTAQGLLVARQRQATVVYPLTYDEAGHNEWLFAANRLTGDTLFTEIFRFSGGDCLGCEPVDTVPEMSSAGYLSMLVDRPATLQVKLDELMFREYSRLTYGYYTFPTDPPDGRPLVDLEGRWALSENHGTDPPLGDLTEFLPAAFEVELEGLFPVADPDASPAYPIYLVSTLTGDPLGQLVCAGRTGPGGRPVCEFIDPTDAAEPLFLFFQDGPASLSIEYGRAVIAVGIPPGGRAQRID